MFLDFFPYLTKCSSLTQKKAMHSCPRTVASCPHLIANRVAVVLLGLLGHFLLRCLLTVLWVKLETTSKNISLTQSPSLSPFFHPPKLLKKKSTIHVRLEEKFGRVR